MAANGKHAYDVVVIGAGNGGLVAAIRVLQAGYSCLLVESTTCPAALPPASSGGALNLRPACTN